MQDEVTKGLWGWAEPEAGLGIPEVKPTPYPAFLTRNSTSSVPNMELLILSCSQGTPQFPSRISTSSIPNEELLNSQQETPHPQFPTRSQGSEWRKRILLPSCLAPWGPPSSSALLSPEFLSLGHFRPQTSFVLPCGSKSIQQQQEKDNRRRKIPKK